MHKIAGFLIILYLRTALSQGLVYNELLEKYQQYLLDNSISLEKSDPCKSPGWNYLLHQKIDFEKCSELVDRLAGSTTDKVLAVYASSYYSNPASVFGHIFLLFQNNNEPKFMNLTLNFAAEIPENTNAIKYIYDGIGGGFKGSFSSLPYFHKVEEYNNIEDRDLWLYELNLNTEEMLLLKLILYDQSQTDLKYYFLNGNCAEKIYSILKIVKNIDDSHFYYSFSPLKSIKLIKKNIGVKHIYYRPSLRKLSLNLENYIFSENIELDKEIFMNEYLFKRRNKKYYLDQQLKLQETRSKINKISVINTEIDVTNEQATPDRAHNESQLFITSKKNSLNIGISFYSHDLLDYQTGYSKFSQLKFGTITINKSEIESLELFSFWNIQPHLYPDWPISYRAELKFNTILASVVQGGVSEEYKDINIYFLSGLTNYFDEKQAPYLINTIGAFRAFDKYKFSARIDVLNDLSAKITSSDYILEARYYSAESMHFDLLYNYNSNMQKDLYFSVSYKY